MQDAQTLDGLTHLVIKGLSEVIRKSSPDIIFVQGDTTTAFAGALSGFYNSIKVCHIEAGLRTGDIMSPWPEEANRKLISIIASTHFAPTKLSKENLLREGVEEKSIKVTGNTVIDALFEVKEIIDSDKKFQINLDKKFNFLNDKKKLILVTGHRRENFGKGFENICLAIKDISKNEDCQVVYPVHLNPNVKKPVKKILGEQKNVFLIDPLEYAEFIYLMDKSYLILTDSGGIQEEAPSLGKPVLVMRENTERPEAIESGTVKLVGVDRKNIFEQASKLINDENQYLKMSKAHNPYGDGYASKRILESLIF